MYLTKIEYVYIVFITVCSFNYWSLDHEEGCLFFLVLLYSLAYREALHRSFSATGGAEFAGK